MGSLDILRKLLPHWLLRFHRCCEKHQTLVQRLQEVPGSESAEHVEDTLQLMTSLLLEQSALLGDARVLLKTALEP